MYRWVKLKLGGIGFKSKARSGRPKALTSKQVKAIKRQLKGTTKSLRDAQRSLKRQGVGVSK